MKAAQMLIDNEFATVEIQEDVVRNCLRVLASTKPMRQTKQVWYRDVETVPCYWTQHWWARLVRWMMTRKWLRHLIPYSVECFANATEISLVPKVWEIPEEVDASIKAQMAGWDKVEPPKGILVGYRANHELKSSRHFSMMPIMAGIQEIEFEYYGIEVTVTQKIEDNGVIVF